MKKTVLLLTGLTLALCAISQTPGVKWTRYIRTSNDGEVFYDIKATPDHGYIAVGADSVGAGQYGRAWMYNNAARATAWIAKLDTSGNMTWRRDNRAVANQSAFTSVVLSVDGGYVAAGYNRQTSGDSSQYYISKFNASGTMLWQKAYGGSRNEYAYSIAKTSSGGFIVAGITESSDGPVVGNHGPTPTTDAWLIKLNGNGDTLWTRCYGGSARDTAYSVIETADKGFVVAGSSRSSDGNLTGNNGGADGWIFKIDSSGNLIWQQNFGGGDADGFRRIVENADGSFTTAGYTFDSLATSNGNKGLADFWVARISNDGTSTLWSKGFGGPVSEMAVSLVRTQDEGYFVTGSTQSNAGDVSGNSGLADSWTIKVTGAGNLAWQKCIGTAKEEFGLALVYQSESNIVIAGSAQPVSAAEPGDGYVARLGNSNIIKGLLYFDLNANGIKDAGEQPVNNAMVLTSKSGFTRASTTVNGIFQVDVETGIYNTAPIIPNFTSFPSGRSSNFASYFSRDSFSFAIRPILNRQDLNIQAIATSVARPGFIVNYRITYKNAGTLATTNPVVLFKKDHRLVFQSSFPAVSSTSGDTLKWNLADLQPLDAGVITLSFQVPAPPTVNLGNVLSSMAIITPIAGDLTPKDDTSILRQVVTGSYDPNDKTDNLGGIITTQQVTAADYINYTIRFQNTGTDTAFTVIIRDTLEARLNGGTIQMIEASHPYQLQIIAPDKLAWTFPDINLPDSNINEPGSHGFITYRVKPVTTLVEGDTIFNNAGIYFDYNLPEFTNEAATVVQDLILLPARLTSFSAIYNKPDALLEWKTVEEQNVGKFEIQRSTDMIHFATVGSVKAKGNLSGGSEYVFRDELTNIGGEKFYYRLRILDIDEKVNYSRIVMINRNGQSRNEVVLNPNPVRGGKAIAWIQFNKDAAADIRVIDMQGRNVFSTRQRISKGYNVVPLDLSTLNSGTYFLQVKAEGKQMLTPFVMAQ